MTDEDEFIILPEYPILGNEYVDSLVLHFCKLKGLTGDYDGDTVSMNGVMSDDSNKQISDYLASKRSMVDANGELIDGGFTDNIKMTLMNMTKDPD
jgi:hypothetical protein